LHPSAPPQTRTRSPCSANVRARLSKYPRSRIFPKAAVENQSKLGSFYSTLARPFHPAMMTFVAETVSRFELDATVTLQ
jgi:hypothetical protein